MTTELSAACATVTPPRRPSKTGIETRGMIFIETLSERIERSGRTLTGITRSPPGTGHRSERSATEERLGARSATRLVHAGATRCLSFDVARSIHELRRERAIGGRAKRHLRQ